MAIAFGAVLSGGTNSSGAGPFAFTGPAVSGSNTLGFAVAFGGDGLDVLTGITWGGSTMTFIAKIKGSVNHFSYLYYITNPSSSASISIAYSGNHFMSGGGIYYTGCSQTGIPDASTTNNNTGASLTTALTSIADNCWEIMVGTTNGATSAGTGSTARTNTGISWDIFDNNAAIHPAGSNSMTFNGVSGAVSAVCATFAPVSVVASVGGPALLTSLAF